MGAAAPFKVNGGVIDLLFCGSLPHNADVVDVAGAHRDESDAGGGAGGKGRRDVAEEAAKSSVWLVP